MATFPTSDHKKDGSSLLCVVTSFCSVLRTRFDFWYRVSSRRDSRCKTPTFSDGPWLFPPWLVERCAFDPEQKQLDISIDFARAVSSLPECGRPGCKAYDTVDKIWRHLNFFQHVTYLHCEPLGWSVRIAG